MIRRIVQIILEVYTCSGLQPCARIRMQGLKESVAVVRVAGKQVTVATPRVLKPAGKAHELCTGSLASSQSLALLFLCLGFKLFFPDCS